MIRLPMAMTLAATACVVSVTISASQEKTNRGQGIAQQPEPPMAGIHWAREHAGKARPSAGSPNLNYHGGPVMTQGAYVEPIYWGTSWSKASFVGDKRSGLALFYSGFSNSSYAGTNSEYTDATGNVGTTTVVAADHVDISTAPKTGNSTSGILAEVCNQASTLVENGYYPVYVDSPRGASRYCAWHSAGTCSNGVTVQFAFFYNLDGDAGCDPEDTSGLHSQGLSALANVSGHELSEALTDPHLNAWYDANGQENSDKCAWVFGTPLLKFSNRSQWKIQGNWSNDAYNSKSGYANRDGQLGCLDGGNYK
jgi:hypothetical protein